MNIKTRLCCSKQFVGKAEGTLRQSNAEHRASIERQETLLGRHFASVCGLANWSIAIIDKVELATNLREVSQCLRNCEGTY